MNLQDLENRICLTNTLEELEKLRLEFLGRSGLLTRSMENLKNLEGQEKIKEGQRLNGFKKSILGLLEKQKAFLDLAQEAKAFSSSALDSTIPISNPKEGRLHPLGQTIQEISDIFASMGFSLENGPEIERDYYNFTALRVPEHHPARATQDTFYLSESRGKDTILLRTQTSPGQIRVMEKQSPPLRVLIPGRVYRVDDWDATHVPMFHQIEGFVVDKGIHMGHLKGCLQEMLNRFFNKEMTIRFRPSFFPFTEPSAEVDILFKKNGSQQDQWLEVLGCGMIHREILESCRINVQEYQGFAFGMGVERLAMLKYGIEDLRHFFENDQRWLTHYGNAPWQ
jgi:phenylalanyl-tRNA synthetase alpha chain